MGWLKNNLLAWKRNFMALQSLKIRGPMLLAAVASVFSTSCSSAHQVSRAIELVNSAGLSLEGGKPEQARTQALEAIELATDSPQILQSAAELLYRAGFVEESVPVFDRVINLAPEDRSHNWQRGIALATCGKFKEGAEQFQWHHDVNPDDVENSAWYFLCLAKSDSLAKARESVIPSRGDARQPMMTILKMLKQEATPEEVIKVGANSRSGQFYAALYVGLYYDSLGDPEKAKKYFRDACAVNIDGYMADTAKVYSEIRFQEKSP